MTTTQDPTGLRTIALDQIRAERNVRGLNQHDVDALALGWPKARVTARVKLLQLPERAQQLVGAGTIALSTVDQLRSIGQVSPELLGAVIAYLADGNEWAAERLAREPGWVLDSALRRGNSRTFAAHMAELGPKRLSCGSGKRRRSCSRKPGSCTSSSIATRMARRRSGSP